MANVKKLSPEQYQMGNRKQRIEVKEGILEGTVLSIRPPTGFERYRHIDFQMAGNHAQAMLFACATCIVAWNLADENGEGLEITESVLSGMDSDVFDALVGLVLPFVQERTREQDRLSDSPAPNSPKDSPDVQ